MIQVPGYLIKREVGVGGMAMVYLAVQTSLEREVALKVMNPAMVSDPSFSRRFMQEARTLASLAHPNIVAVYDVGITEEKLHYFSMQHLPNGDFLGRIHHGVPESEVVRVLAGVARALGYAHQRGFVHRDVAPGNVLFDINDNPVLTDFGIARAVTKTSRITNAGVSVGTSHYMSPEQARGGEVDGRSDIYSLGALAYEALTGNPPYNGEDGFAIAYAHVFEPVPRLPEEKQRWQGLIDKSMAKDPSERYQNTEEFLAELSRLEPLSRAPASSSAATLNMALPAGLVVPVTATSTPVAVPASGAAAASAAATSPPASAPAAQRESSVAEPALADLPTGPGRAVHITKPNPLSAARAPRGPVPKAVWIVLGTLMLGAILVTMGIWQQRADKPLAQPAGAATDPVAVPAPDGAPPLTANPTAATDSNPDPVGFDAESSTDIGLTDAGEELGEDGLPLAADPEMEAQMRDALATTVVDPIAFLTAMGRADIAAQRLSQPPGRNATDRYNLLLRMRPDSSEAKTGLVNTGRAFMRLAEERLAEGKIAEWMDYAGRAIEVAGVHDTAGELRGQFERKRNSLTAPLLSEGAKAVELWNEADARRAYERVLELHPGNKDAVAGLKRAAAVGKPGYPFVDNESARQPGPAMIVATVAGKRVGVARGEITVAEFRRFWAAGGSSKLAARPSCRDRESLFRSSRSRTWQAPGFTQSGDHPVVCISWDDAQAYAEWLSKVTGRRYRLLTAAEWSALAKAQDRGASCKANVGDSQFNGKYRERAALACDDGFAETAPVRRFAAVGGVHDLAGNVREWVSDCEAGCRKHLALGSSWASTGDELDLAARNAFDTDTGFNTIGLRVVRELD